jgi:hypothetical protein
MFEFLIFKVQTLRTISDGETTKAKIVDLKKL